MHVRKMSTRPEDVEMNTERFSHHKTESIYKRLGSLRNRFVHQCYFKLLKDSGHSGVTVCTRQMALINPLLGIDSHRTV